MSEKMIPVRGKQVSEATIVEALQKHCGFEEKKYVFQAGDVIVLGNSRDIYIIIDNHGVLESFWLDGIQREKGQAEFESKGYKKIGVLSDFIKGS